MSAKKWKPCPFCGKIPIIKKYKEYLDDSPFIITCCSMINYNCGYKTKRRAVTTWNKQRESAIIAAQADELDRIKKAVQKIIDSAVLSGDSQNPIYFVPQVELEGIITGEQEP